jgi:hypothetical protein
MTEVKIKPAVEKDLRFNLKIRVYGNGLNQTASHGYCVDDCPWGVSAPIGEIYIDVRQITFKVLRPMIEYDKTNSIIRRHPTFQEALYIMTRLPNLYDRPKLELNKYIFGFVTKDKKEVKLIHPSRESDFIANSIGATDFFNHDLVIVPLSQISPAVLLAIAPKEPKEPQGLGGNSSPLSKKTRESGSRNSKRNVIKEATKASMKIEKEEINVNLNESNKESLKLNISTSPVNTSRKNSKPMTPLMTKSNSSNKLYSKPTSPVTNLSRKKSTNNMSIK